MVRVVSTRRIDRRYRSREMYGWGHHGWEPDESDLRRLRHEREQAAIRQRGERVEETLLEIEIEHAYPEHGEESNC